MLIFIYHTIIVKSQHIHNMVWKWIYTHIQRIKGIFKSNPSLVNQVTNFPFKIHTIFDVMFDYTIMVFTCFIQFVSMRINRF
jgi:hypothetical protein